MCFSLPSSGQENNWNNRMWLGYHENVLKLHSYVYFFKSFTEENIKKRKEAATKSCSTEQVFFFCDQKHFKTPANELIPQ